MNVEAIFRYVDADEDGALFVHNPNLANAGSGPSGCPGVGLRWWRPHQALSRAFEPQADAGWPPPLASPVSFRRATQTYKSVGQIDKCERAFVEHRTGDATFAQDQTAIVSTSRKSEHFDRRTRPSGDIRVPARQSAAACRKR